MDKDEADEYDRNVRSDLEELHRVNREAEVQRRNIVKASLLFFVFGIAARVYEEDDLFNTTFIGVMVFFFVLMVISMLHLALCKYISWYLGRKLF